MTAIIAGGKVIKQPTAINPRRGKEKGKRGGGKTEEKGATGEKGGKTGRDPPHCLQYSLENAGIAGKRGIRGDTALSQEGEKREKEWVGGEAKEGE